MILTRVANGLFLLFVVLCVALWITHSKIIAGIMALICVLGITLTFLERHNDSR